MTNGAGLIPVRSSATINARSFTACSSQPAVTQLEAVNLDFLSNKQLALPTEESQIQRRRSGRPRFWRISHRSNRPERIRNNVNPLGCSPLRKASSCLEKFCIVALILLLPSPKFKPDGSANAASRTRPMHRARKRSRQNINTCTRGARTQSCHKQAIEAAFLNEIDQLRP